MSYQEKRSIAHIISAVLVTALYSVFMAQRYPTAEPYSPEIFQFWGVFFLAFVPVSIVARILMYVVFTGIHYSQTREEHPPIADERDQLIELRAGKLSVRLFMVGLILAMAVLVIEQPPAAMFIILLGAIVVSDVVGEIAQFRFYRRGF